MDVIFSFLGLGCLAALAVGLVQPSLVVFWTRRRNKCQAVLGYVFAALVFFLLALFVLPDREAGLEAVLVVPIVMGVVYIAVGFISPLDAAFWSKEAGRTEVALFGGALILLGLMLLPVFRTDTSSLVQRRLTYVTASVTEDDTLYQLAREGIDKPYGAPVRETLAAADFELFRTHADVMAFIRSLRERARAYQDNPRTQMIAGALMFRVLHVYDHLFPREPAYEKSQAIGIYLFGELVMRADAARCSDRADPSRRSDRWQRMIGRLLYEYIDGNLNIVERKTLAERAIMEESRIAERKPVAWICQPLNPERESPRIRIVSAKAWELAREQAHQAFRTDVMR